jgi:Bacterial EndoU nuclease
MIEKSGIFEFANKVVDITGVYKAELLYMGEHVKEITFFPAHWSREQVISKIYEAYDNFIKSGALTELRPDGKYLIKGLTNEGIEIEMLISQKGKIVTAYPNILVNI